MQSPAGTSTERAFLRALRTNRDTLEPMGKVKIFNRRETEALAKQMGVTMSWKGPKGPWYSESSVTNHRGTFKMKVRFLQGTASVKSVQVNAWKEGFEAAEELYRAHSVALPVSDTNQAETNTEQADSQEIVKKC